MSKIELKYIFDSDEELRAHLGAETRVAAPVVTETVETAAPAEAELTETVAPAETEGDVEVDADGMPYDPEIHTESKSKTTAGLWKARQGKADEASAARDAFKAAGGDITPPVIAGEDNDEQPGLPGLDALPADAPPPVSLDALVGKVAELQKDGKFDAARWSELMRKHGVKDPNAELAVNETARAAIYAELCAE